MGFKSCGKCTRNLANKLRDKTISSVSFGIYLTIMHLDNNSDNKVKKRLLY